MSMGDHITIQDLPIDIQNRIKEKVLFEREPRVVLTNALQEDIVSYAYFDDVVYLYKVWAEKMTRSDVTYLEFLENDMLLLLNDSIPILRTIQPDLQCVFPLKSHHEIVLEIAKTHTESSQVTSVLKRYWTFLSPPKRALLRKEIYNDVLEHSPH